MQKSNDKKAVRKPRTQGNTGLKAKMQPTPQAEPLEQVVYCSSALLIDYTSTKDTVVSLTRSLSQTLVERNIRVNGVAPGPVWTPLIASGFDKEKVAKHGSDVPMKRAGEPNEFAPCYLLLACSDSYYITGQVLHLNVAEIING